jgi:hypothetical protein
MSWTMRSSEARGHQKILALSRVQVGLGSRFNWHAVCRNCRCQILKNFFSDSPIFDLNQIKNPTQKYQFTFYRAANTECRDPDMGELAAPMPSAGT